MLTVLYLSVSDICETYLDVVVLSSIVIYIYSYFDFLENKFSKEFYEDSLYITEGSFHFIEFFEKIYLKIKSKPQLFLN